MAKLSLFLESLGSIDSIAKLNFLVDELKRRKTIITEEVNKRVLNKIIGKEILACWIQMKNAELRILHYKVKNKVKPQKKKKGKSETYVARQGLSDDDPIKKTQRLNKQLTKTSDGNEKEDLYEAYEYGISDW